MFKSILIIGKPPASAGEKRDACTQALSEIHDFLLRLNYHVMQEDAHSLEKKWARLALTRPDLAIVVGGDGTMLSAARQLAIDNIPIIGINQGRLGFMTDIAFEHFEQTLTPMLRGEFEAEHRPLLQGQVLRGNTVVFHAIAVNDIVINRRSTQGMIELGVHVNGQFVAQQRADGLIIATPTGSTAYALSAGGSLLHPCLAGWIVAPIAPHNLSNRPIVLPDNCEIVVEQLCHRSASVNFDMQSLAGLEQGDRVVVKRAQHHAQFLHPRGWNYFDSLRHKLRWNES